jgi:hypothetical protein
MIVATTFDEFRRRVLVPEGLDDPSKFLAADFFDEIPLYSRYEQIEPFLRHGHSADKVLLDLALEYLAEICGDAKASRGFVAAITIPDDKDSRYIVPSVFVCKGRIRQRLHGLRLRKPLTAFSKRIAGILKRIDSRTALGVLEDTLTVPGEVRAFISYPDMLDQMTCVGVPKDQCSPRS